MYVTVVNREILGVVEQSWPYDLADADLLRRARFIRRLKSVSWVDDVFGDTYRRVSSRNPFYTTGGYVKRAHPRSEQGTKPKQWRIFHATCRS
jgi:hypothetical protein